eukprot:96719_1
MNALEIADYNFEIALEILIEIPVHGIDENKNSEQKQQDNVAIAASQNSNNISGIDANTDPELEMAIRQSLEEERQQQEADVKKSAENKTDLYTQQNEEKENENNQNDEKEEEKQEIESHNVTKSLVSSDTKQKKAERKESLSENESVANQFRNFLTSMHMEKYFDEFKNNDCCDMSAIYIFDDDGLKTDIGIKSLMGRRKFLRKCDEIKKEMNRFKNECGISDVLYHRLEKYGIVTMNILCDEVKDKSDLKHKFKITNENQCNILWKLIQQIENYQQNNSNEIQQNDVEENTTPGDKVYL